MTQIHFTDRPGMAGGPTVVFLPGLTSTGRAGDAVAAALPEARVVSPDLRGRGDSATLGGPTGLHAHAVDVAELLGELDLDDVVLVGHSMGAFLAPVVAQVAGGRVCRLVLLDGGIPPKLPFLFTPSVVRAVFRRQLRKLERPWPSVEAYLDANIGRAIDGHPELRPQLVESLRHDLAGEDGALRPRIDVDRAVADAVDTFFGPHVEPALDALTVPAHLLAARWQKRDRGRPFIADSVIAHWTARQPLLTAERVEANHLTLLYAPETFRAVATAPAAP